MTSQRLPGRTAAIILALTICTGLVHVFLMPPFQNPDEVQHYLLCASHAYDRQHMEQVETDVLKAMKQYKWFHFVGIGPGWQNTKKISDVSFVFHFNPARKSNRNTIFHFFYGKMLSVSGITDALSGFYFLRILSTLVYAGFILLGFLFFRAYFPELKYYLTAGLLLVFQFATIMNAVNYDVFMVLVGSVFFMTAYAYMTTRKKILLLYMIGLAALASLTKLVGFIFILYIILLLAVMALGKLKKTGWNTQRLKQAGFIVLAVIIGFSWMNYLFPERFYNLYSLIARVFGDFTYSFSGGQSFNPSFFNAMIDSFYFHTGWMGFKIGGTWYFLLKLALLFSLAGVCIKIFSRRPTNDSSTPAPKPWYVYTLLVLFFQCLAIWLYYGDKVSAQGRYLFPLVIPVIILIYSGLKIMENRFNLKRNYIIIGFLLFQTVMTIFCLVRIISVFYLELSSPHPGL